MKKSKALALTMLTALSMGLVGITTSASNAEDASGFLSSYVDAPAVQNSYIVGHSMTFDADCPLIWPGIGSTDVACTSTSPDTYGGASTDSSDPFRGGVGSRYATVWPGTPMTLTLDTPATYFGLWWSAGDGNNLLQFYSDDTLLGTFSFDTLMTALTSQSLNGDGGSVYTTADYFGNPVDSSNGGEPYAYLHVFAAGDKTFNKVVFTQIAGGGFEFDNVTIASGTNKTAETLVHLEGPVSQPEPDPDPSPSPSPSPSETPETTALADTGKSDNQNGLTALAGILLLLGSAVLVVAKKSNTRKIGR